MTECERIIKEGILPASFFEEETICDFLVTKERKKIWAISLDLLIQVDRICRKHNLKYFMAFGSLLGIVRHNGFIPWDDDLDICMTREDYEKFIEIAPKELADPYFLQVSGKDYDYFFSFAKLRNSNTTGANYTFRYCKFNQGLGIDIFALDNYHQNESESERMQLKKLFMENSANMRRSNPNPSPADVKRINEFPIRSPSEILAEINAIFEYANRKDSNYCIPSITIYDTHKMIYKWADILDLTDVDFYGYRFLIPKNFNTILTTTYGDYMQFPPIEERGLWHKNALFNPDKPYKESLKDLLKAEENQTK